MEIGILISVLVTLIVAWLLVLWMREKLDEQYEGLKSLIELKVENTFEQRKRDAWWAVRDAFQEDLKKLTAQHFYENNIFHSSVKDKFIACNNDMKELTAKIDRLQQTDGIAAEDVGEIRQMCLELQKANTVLMRTILERFPLPEKPTTPVRRKR